MSARPRLNIFKTIRLRAPLGHQRPWNLACIFCGSGDKTSRKRNFEFRPLCRAREMTHPEQVLIWLSVRLRIFKQQKNRYKILHDGQPVIQCVIWKFGSDNPRNLQIWGQERCWRGQFLASRTPKLGLSILPRLFRKKVHRIVLTFMSTRT